MTDIDIDVHAPEEGEENAGLVLVDGWAYTPDDVRRFASTLLGLADYAENGS